MFNAKLDSIKLLLKEFNSRIKNIEARLDEHATNINSIVDDNKQDVILQKLRDCNADIDELNRYLHS